jgi:hypothetical protein
MIDALGRAFSQIYNTIPRPILEAAFDAINHPDQSLDDLIKEKVLLSRVRDDVSIRGGKVFDLILQLDWALHTSSPSPYALGISGSYSTYKVPPEAREHRDISCVLNVRFPYTISASSTGSFYNSASVSGNSLGGMACVALNSTTGAGQMSNPTAVVRPGNVIQLTPNPQYNFIPWRVKVRLRYDDNFSGMDVSSIKPFEMVCVEAVKAYVWTALVMKIESNMVYRGADIGIMKDIVSGYSDANEKYEENLLALGGAEVYDPERLYGILSMCVPKK